MNQQNPFAAPTVDLAPSPGGSAKRDDDTLGAIAKRTFLAWEKLRFLYVAILAAECLLFGSRKLADPEFWGLIVFGGVVSNLCFFAGPIVETYVTWLGFQARWLRWLLFVLGTLFTMLAAFIAVSVVALPGQQ